MILWRLLPLVGDVAPSSPGGALWFPRELQGTGRHDNPGRYGCLYLSESPMSAVAEALVPFRGTGELSQRCSSAQICRSRSHKSIARTMRRSSIWMIPMSSHVRGCVPPGVATKARAVAQAYAARLFDKHPAAVGLRWWSTLEASLTNFTLYDRAAPILRLIDVEALTLEHSATREAADLLGLTIKRRS